MREERLFQIIGQLDEDLIMQADAPVKAHLPWQYYAKLAGWAASFVLLAGLGSIVFQHTLLSDQTDSPTAEYTDQETPPDDNHRTPPGADTNTPSLTDSTNTPPPVNTTPAPTPADNTATPTPITSPTPEQTEVAIIDGLPVLTLEFNYDGMGFEGYMAHDFEELKNANPWSEDLGLTHLPVFKNNIIFGEHYGSVENPDWDAMETTLLDVANRFGLTELTYERIEESFSFPRIEGQSGDISIQVDINLSTTITNKATPASLPEEFSYSSYNMPYEEYYAIAEYLQEEYTDFLAMDNPCININGGDYNIYDDQSYDISFYDACEDPVQRILNYNFNQVQFYLFPYGDLWLFNIRQYDLSNVTGYYPIISVEEATELLLDHKYATTVPYELPGEEYIRGCELIYRHHYMEEYALPYYRFYVELPEERTVNENILKNGLIIYGTYYVPAVEEKYIANMPVWDLQFN